MFLFVLKKEIGPESIDDEKWHTSAACNPDQRVAASLHYLHCNFGSRAARGCAGWAGSLGGASGQFAGRGAVGVECTTEWQPGAKQREKERGGGGDFGRGRWQWYGGQPVNSESRMDSDVAVTATLPNGAGGAHGQSVQPPPFPHPLPLAGSPRPAGPAAPRPKR